MRVATAAILAASATSGAAAPTPDAIYLTVVYCPSVFSGSGAVVRVDGTTFEPEVVSKFAYPDGIDQSCPMDEDANFFSDTVTGTRRTHLSFGTVRRLVVVV